MNRKLSIPGAVSAALTAMIVATALFAAPGANAAWTVKGGGFGHGIGMSAYGAYGMAEHGWRYRKILRHYYQHTRIRELRKARTVRVLLNIDPGNVYFSGAERACGVDLTESRTYGARLAGNRVRLIRQNGKKLADCGRRLKTENDGQTVVDPQQQHQQWYRPEHLDVRAIDGTYRSTFRKRKHRDCSAYEEGYDNRDDGNPDRQPEPLSEEAEVFQPARIERRDDVPAPGIGTLPAPRQQQGKHAEADGQRSP